MYRVTAFAAGGAKKNTAQVPHGAVDVLLVAFSLAVLFVPQFCGPFENGQEFGVMADGDEFCLRPGESGGRINVDSALADCFLQRLPRHGQFRTHRKMGPSTLTRGDVTTCFAHGNSAHTQRQETSWGSRCENWQETTNTNHGGAEAVCLYLRIVQEPWSPRRVQEIATPKFDKVHVSARVYDRRR